MTKQCSRCQQHYPLDDFYSDHRAPDHKVGTCKHCYRMDRAARKAARPVIEKLTPTEYASQHSVESILADMRRRLKGMRDCRVHENDLWKHDLQAEEMLEDMDRLRRAKVEIAEVRKAVAVSTEEVSV
jgi:hypothetical protein